MLTQEILEADAEQDDVDIVVTVAVRWRPRDDACDDINRLFDEATEEEKEIDS